MKKSWYRDPETYPTRTADVSRFVRERGFRLTLIQGNGYLYFLDDAGYEVGYSVPVCYVSHLKFSAWLGEARECVIVELDRHEHRDTGRRPGAAVLTEADATEAVRAERDAKRAALETRYGRGLDGRTA